MNSFFTRIICSREEKIFSFLVVLMAWANVYKLPSAPLGIGEIILFLFIPLFCKRGMNFSLYGHERLFVLWLIYAVLITLALFNYFGAPITKFFSMARVAFYWTIIFIFGKNLFNLNYFKKWMYVFSIALSLFIFLQSFLYITKGIYLPGYFLNAPLNDGGMTGMQMYEQGMSRASWRGFLRPNGFLCEPAHCVQFLFVSLIVSITEQKLTFIKKNILVSLFSVAIILTLSTTGICLLLFAWLVYVFIENRLSVFRLPVGIMFLIVIAAVLSGSIDSGNHAVGRIVNILDGTDIDGSSNIRLNNGLNMFGEIPFFLKIIGTGIGLFEFVSLKLNFGDVMSYMNTFSGILFMSGFLGSIIWHSALFYVFYKTGLLGKCLSAGFFVLTLGCSVFCQPVMVWLFLIVFADIKEKNDRCSCSKLQ